MNEVRDFAVDRIHAFDGAFVGRPDELRFFDFVEGLFRDARIRNRGPRTWLA